MEMYTWFDPSFYKSGIFDADVTITGLTANTNFNIKLPTGASSNFRVQASGGGNLFQVNQSSGNWIFSQTNQSICADTSDGSDNKYLYLCGGGGNSVGRGARCILSGNEVSGSQGIAYLWSGDASSAYVDLNAATSVSGSIRFKINSIDVWRMTGDNLISYATSFSQIGRINNTSHIRIFGGSSSTVASGAWIEAHGISSGSGEGILRFYTGNHVNSHSIHIIGNASANHRFYIVGNERFTITDTGIVFPSLADGDAGNNRTYYSTTQSKLCYKDSGGAVNVLY